MKKYTITSLCFLLLACLATAHAKDIYVSKEGSDANDGSASQPLATLAAAQAKARLYAGKEAVTVWVADGTYHLNQTLRFESADSGTADSPITYRTAPGATVTLKGSLPLDSTNWKPWKDGIYKQSLKGSALEGRPINQLFMSDERMVRARFPNWDFNNPLRSGKGYLTAGGKDAPSMKKISWKEGPLDERVSQWKHPEQAILHAFHARNWGNFQFRVGRVDAENRTFHFSDGGWQAQRRERGVGGKGGHSSPFYIENIFEELDAQFE